MAQSATLPDPAFAEEVLILAPTGQDSHLLSRALQKDGVRCQIFAQMDGVTRRLGSDAGALLLAEEALEGPALQQLKRTLSMQEPWSDVPIILMTTGGETTLLIRRLLRDFTPAGNVTLIERPFRPITLVSSVQVALRARRRQFEVRTLLERQREATRIRDEFISIASHELKTPLTSLKLQTQLNKRLISRNDMEAADAAKRFQKFVQVSGEQVERLARLIEDMLDVSRINAGKLALSKMDVDFGVLVREVIDRTSPQVNAAGCELILDVAGNLHGHWDRYRLEQVIINLVTNAIRYGGGKPIQVRARKDGPEVLFEVKDQGVGIAPEDQERIFRRFERAPQSRNIDGLGLGLYICSEIVSAHGGTIGVESVPGRGATFMVRLPAGRT